MFRPDSRQQDRVHEAAEPLVQLAVRVPIAALGRDDERDVIEVRTAGFGSDQNSPFGFSLIFKSTR